MVNTTPQASRSQTTLTKRGLVSFTLDGRYKFGRYYAPTAWNTRLWLRLGQRIESMLPEFICFVSQCYFLYILRNH
jgi:hypothetical protein